MRVPEKRKLCFMYLFWLSVFFFFFFFFFFPFFFPFALLEPALLNANCKLFDVFRSMVPTILNISKEESFSTFFLKKKIFFSLFPLLQMADLAKELNKGGDITSGLKKVARADTNKDKQISGKVEVKEGAPKAAAAPKQPARVELNGNKWTVEFQHHTKEPVVVKVS